MGREGRLGRPEIDFEYRRMSLKRKPRRVTQIGKTARGGSAGKAKSRVFLRKRRESIRAAGSQ